MNSLYRRIMAAILLTVLVILGIVVFGLFSGYNRSLAAWSTERRFAVERAARETLRASRADDPRADYPRADDPHRDGPWTGDAGTSEPSDIVPPAALLPLDVPVFIYDRDRELIASNRGVGRRRELEGMPLNPVRTPDGTVLGYYSVGAAQFQADTANQALLAALRRAAVAALLAAVVLAVVSAPMLARSLSRPAREVAAGIDRMAEGALETRIPEVGVREIAGIARSANLLAARLEEEQQIRAQWVQDVAHDLRSPVAMIKAQIEAIADGVYAADPPRMRRLMGELGRMEQLISDLDELMRLEAPGLSPERREFSARSFLEDLRERFTDLLAENSMTLETTIVLESGAVTDVIQGDENLLYRAVSNLIANAIRYGTGNIVRCTVGSVDHDVVRISVWNDGPTVPPEDLSRVFDRLYRGEYARNTPGSGLGLTIARRIAELHGGTIRMDSAAGSGTTVTIELPGVSASRSADQTV